MTLPAPARPRLPRAALTAAVGALLAGLVGRGAAAELPPVDMLEIGPRVLSDQKTAHHASVNELVVKAVNEMPREGGYAASGKSFAALGEAISIDTSGRLVLAPERAKPCFCSGGTYLVFLAVLDRLNREGRITLTPEAARALQMQHQADGAGIWGRWNANGPGTARLFYELRLGSNFNSFDKAEPGDFMKVWWTDEIGAKEHGHSVIYLGSSDEGKEPMVKFWSANVPEGYSFKTIPRSKIKRVLFSRLERPQYIEEVAKLSPRDPYLADMLKRGSTEKEMLDKVGASTRR